MSNKADRLKRLYLVRTESLADTAELGEIKTELGEHVCMTLEHPWRDNTRLVSCIPEGNYRWRKFSSDRHGMCFQIRNVPGRDSIQIHVGNSLSDTQGCILVGLARSGGDVRPALINSHRAMEKLYRLCASEGQLTVKYGMDRYQQHHRSAVGVLTDRTSTYLPEEAPASVGNSVPHIIGDHCQEVKK